MTHWITSRDQTDHLGKFDFFFPSGTFKKQNEMLHMSHNDIMVSKISTIYPDMEHLLYVAFMRRLRLRGSLFHACVAYLPQPSLQG